MALLLAVVFGLLAYANAGYMMQSMQPQQQMMVPVGSGGCNRDSNGQLPGGCVIPENEDNMEEYLEKQMQQQQYETQAMAEKIRAQFEGLVKNMTMKKQRFAMSLVTEYIAMCECGRSSDQLYSALFLNQAKTLNLTDSIDNFDYTRMPYEAKTEEEARMLIFSGVVRGVCTAALNYLSFADQVNQRLPALGKK